MHQAELEKRLVYLNDPTLNAAAKVLMESLTLNEVENNKAVFEFMGNPNGHRINVELKIQDGEKKAAVVNKEITTIKGVPSCEIRDIKTVADLTNEVIKIRGQTNWTEGDEGEVTIFKGATGIVAIDLENQTFDIVNKIWEDETVDI